MKTLRDVILMNDKSVSWDFIDIFLIYIASLLFGTSLFVDLAHAILPEPRGPMLEFSINVVCQYGSFILFMTIILLWRGASWKEVGLRPSSWSAVKRYGIGGGLLLAVSISFLGVILAWLRPDLEGQYFSQVLNDISSWSHILITFLSGVVIGPVVEELFFRGMVYPLMRKYCGVIWGIVATGVMFGLSHFDLWRALPLALGGMGLCYIYEKTDSIWPPIIAHGLWNGIMYLFVILPLL